MPEGAERAVQAASRLVDPGWGGALRVARVGAARASEVSK
jgi:hypothetical protein